MIGSTRPSKPFILGVAGGSGSGKTTFARALQSRLGADRCEVVSQDNFYIDQSARFDRDGGAVNFDHPEAIDFELLADRVRELKSGVSVEIPIYDFASHTRAVETLRIRAVPVILVDGILILHSAKLRALFDECVFFDTSEELRFQRRLARDVRERGRTPDGVRSQFFGQVKPMHDRFVEPSKVFAGHVVGDQAAFDALLARLSTR